MRVGEQKRTESYFSSSKSLLASPKLFLTPKTGRTHFQLRDEMDFSAPGTDKYSNDELRNYLDMCLTKGT